ncbi:unnamed protein product [Peronospora belbahrii]|nr:unnamed protein product [Peronospora belbahrii]
MRVWLHRKTKECELKLRWFVPTVAIRFPNHLEEWCRMVLSFAMDTLPCKKGIVHDQTGCGSEGLCKCYCKGNFKATLAQEAHISTRIV